MDVDKDVIRKKLKDIGAQLVKPEYLQKRVVFNLPKGMETEKTWLRVIEATNEQAVKKIAQKMGFDYSKALFCSATSLYSKKYGVSHDIINNQTPRITFNMKNPFLKRK